MSWCMTRQPHHFQQPYIAVDANLEEWGVTVMIDLFKELRVLGEGNPLHRRSRLVVRQWQVRGRRPWIEDDQRVGTIAHGQRVVATPLCHFAASGMKFRAIT